MLKDTKTKTQRAEGKHRSAEPNTSIPMRLPTKVTNQDEPQEQKNLMQ